MTTTTPTEKPWHMQRQASAFDFVLNDEFWLEQAIMQFIHNPSSERQAECFRISFEEHLKSQEE